MAETYRVRWTVSMDVLVTATAEDEEAAYDLAYEMAKERLEQVSVTINDVAIYGDVDGVAADEFVLINPPEAGER